MNVNLDHSLPERQSSTKEEEVHHHFQWRCFVRDHLSLSLFSLVTERHILLSFIKQILHTTLPYHTHISFLQLH